MADQTDASTPYVNGETMQNFIGKRVCLACQLESMNGERVNVKTSDGLDVTVRTTSGKEYGSSFVKVLGTVESPNSIVEEFHSNLGDSYDLKLYNETVKLFHGKFADIFMSPS